MPKPFYRSERPPCPECGMGMIVIDGAEREIEHYTFRCLRCGHVEPPEVKPQRIHPRLARAISAAAKPSTGRSFTCSRDATDILISPEPAGRLAILQTAVIATRIRLAERLGGLF